MLNAYCDLCGVHCGKDFLLLSMKFGGNGFIERKELITKTDLQLCESCAYEMQKDLHERIDAALGRSVPNQMTGE